MVFVHGMSGSKSWTSMIGLLKPLEELMEWDIYSYNYISKPFPRFVRFGMALSPRLSTVSEIFVTECEERLKQYSSIALIGHSAGGIVIQRAILDSRWLKLRTTHIALFGTPSGGVKNAWKYLAINPQVLDILRSSKFMARLWQDAGDFFTQMTSFKLRIIAARDDTTVPADSVYHKFPKQTHKRVPGDHVSMIRPKAADASVVVLLNNFLLSPSVFLSYVREDEARVLEVYETLDARELGPWVDQRNLVAGVDWAMEIYRELQDSDAFLVFLTEQSINELKNLEGVFRSEVDTAIRIQEERHEEENPFLIPVRLENCDIPDFLSSFQAFDHFARSSQVLADLLEQYTGS